MMNTPIKSRSQAGDGSAVVTPEGAVKESSGDIIPHDNDVLCGRGGSINSHPGNERFRVLVERRKRVYLTARFKREKRLIAEGIVSEIRSQDPPGRFLAKTSKDGPWHDIGDDKAKDKTSQALRENAPSIRAEIETEINQQRAEMKRAEEEEAARASAYHQQSWGGYFGSYYGYGQDYGSPPPGPPPPHHSHPPPPHGHPPPPHGPPTPHEHPSGPYHQPSYDSRWGTENSHHNYDHHQHMTPSPSHQPSSEEARKTASSVPSSFSAWTKSFSFGGHSASSSDGDRSGRNSTTPRKPLTYTHQPYPVQEQSSSMDQSEGHKRLVHFQEDPYQYHGDKRYRDHYDQSPSRYYQDSGRPGRPEHPRHHEDRYGSDYSSPRHGHQGEMTMPYSPITNRSHNEDHISSEIQPHSDTQMDFGEGRQESSLLSQVANHILTSWDTTTICAHGSTDVDDHSLFAKSTSVQSSNANSAPHTLQQQESIESEGQEVELIEMMDYDQPHGSESLAVVDEEARMPPPGDEKPRVEIDWPAQIGSCHNWIPDTLSASALFGPKGSFDAPLSPVGSVTMVGSGDLDGSAANPEGFSCAGSIGGDSFCQVFKQEGLVPEQTKQEAIASEPAFGSMGNTGRTLSPIPSWERSFRSKSLSDVDSNPSLVSKNSDKNRDGFASPITVPSPKLGTDNGHNWEHDQMDC